MDTLREPVEQESDTTYNLNKSQFGINKGIE